MLSKAVNRLLEWRKACQEYNKTHRDTVRELPRDLAQDLEMTRNSILALYQDLRQRGIQLIPRRVSQNCVESYFSAIRSRGNAENITPSDYRQRNGLLLSIGARACDAPRNHHRSYEVESFSPLTLEEWQDLAKELSNEQHRWVLKHGAGSERVVDSSELEEIRVLSAQELERRMRSDVVKRNPNYFFTWRQSAVNHYISNYIAGAILRSCLKMSCWSVPCKQLLSCLAVEDERTHLLRVSSHLSALAQVICGRFYSVATPRSLTRLQDSLFKAAIAVTGDSTVLQFWLRTCEIARQQCLQLQEDSIEEEEIRRVGQVYCTKFTKCLIGDLLSQHALDKANELSFRKRVDAATNSTPESICENDDSMEL